MRDHVRVLSWRGGGGSCKDGRRGREGGRREELQRYLDARAYERGSECDLLVRMNVQDKIRGRSLEMVRALEKDNFDGIGWEHGMMSRYSALICSVLF